MPCILDFPDWSVIDSDHCKQLSRNQGNSSSCHRHNQFKPRRVATNFSSTDNSLTPSQARLSSRPIRPPVRLSPKSPKPTGPTLIKPLLPHERPLKANGQR